MNINFMQFSKKMLVLSLISVFCSIVFIFNCKIDFGLEFVGGLEVELYYFKNVNLDDLKRKFIKLDSVHVKYYGSSKNIQLKVKTRYHKEEIINNIEHIIADEAKIVRVDYIGPEMTQTVIKNSFKASMVAIFLMVLYLVFRFNYILALNALIALIHDIIIVLGVVALFNIEFNLAVFSALFAVFGYSINDTIVIFDRLRENTKLYKEKDMYSLINMSINSTLSRTLNTSISTLVVTLIILFFGGTYLFGFALVLCFGIIIGTYSSIYLSTYLMLIKN